MMHTSMVEGQRNEGAMRAQEARINLGIQGEHRSAAEKRTAWNCQSNAHRDETWKAIAAVKQYLKTPLKIVTMCGNRISGFASTRLHFLCNCFPGSSTPLTPSRQGDDGHITDLVGAGQAHKAQHRCPQRQCHDGCIGHTQATCI
eukprot:2253368-Amphidinium_carterae.3